MGVLGDYQNTTRARWVAIIDTILTDKAISYFAISIVRAKDIFPITREREAVYKVLYAGTHSGTSVARSIHQ